MSAVTSRTYTAAMSADPATTEPAQEGRRSRYSEGTRRALVDVAEDLFTARGFAATSLDAIVARAEVTKGAVYHHFSGKQALFEAVFERVESAASGRVRDALEAQRDPWQRALAGLGAFLDVVAQPAYRRVIVQDAPAILGFERSREREERTFESVREIVRAVLGADGQEVDADVVETFSRIFFGAMSSAGEWVSTAADPVAAGARVEAAMSFILTGCRQLAEQGRVPRLLG